MSLVDRAIQAFLMENLRKKQEMDKYKAHMDEITKYSSTIDEFMGKLTAEELSKMFSGE